MDDNLPEEADYEKLKRLISAGLGKVPWMLQAEGDRTDRRR